MQGHESLQSGDSALGAHYTLLAPGTVTQAARQMQGAHVLCVSGEATTVSFAAKTSGRIATHWRRGLLAGLTGMQFHQHSNTGKASAAFLKVELGSQASPLFRSRRAAYGDTEVYASGSAVMAAI
jgi:hypothetical protein